MMVYWTCPVMVLIDSSVLASDSMKARAGLAMGEDAAVVPVEDAAGA